MPEKQSAIAGFIEIIINFLNLRSNAESEKGFRELWELATKSTKSHAAMEYKEQICDILLDMITNQSDLAHTPFCENLSTYGEAALGVVLEFVKNDPNLQSLTGRIVEQWDRYDETLPLDQRTSKSYDKIRNDVASLREMPPENEVSDEGRSQQRN
jgi:hypothetical protein